jgi:hypothetical protein
MENLYLRASFGFFWPERYPIIVLKKIFPSRIVSALVCWCSQSFLLVLLARFFFIILILPCSPLVLSTSSP